MSEIYRTRTNAGDVLNMPAKYAVISHKDYMNAFGLLQEGKAYLVSIAPGAEMSEEYGALFIDSMTAQEYIKRIKIISEVKDLTLLRLIYSIVLYNAQIHGERILKQNPLKIYIPDLLRFIGKKTISKNEIFSIISSFKVFERLVGVIDGSVLKVMVLSEIDNNHNTVSFDSPYIKRLISEIPKDYEKRFAKGGKSIIPSHSYVIKPEIRNERNERAVEIVHIISVLIERAGGFTPHISVGTILNRMITMKQALTGMNPSDANKVLKRTFSKAWELLRDKTELLSVYKDLRLPSPVNKADIPTVSRQDMVFEFPNKGKRKEREKEQEREEEIYGEEPQI